MISLKHLVWYSVTILIFAFGCVIYIPDAITWHGLLSGKSNRVKSNRVKSNRVHSRPWPDMVDDGTLQQMQQVKTNQWEILNLGGWDSSHPHW
jgi:hypothetical protein